MSIKSAVSTEPDGANAAVTPDGLDHSSGPERGGPARAMPAVGGRADLSRVVEIIVADGGST